MEQESDPGTRADEELDGSRAPAVPSTPPEPVMDATLQVPEAEAVAALRARHAVLESRLARAEEENHAFVRSLRHAAAAAEELLAEAGQDAEACRAAAEREAEQIRAAAEREADEIRETARREAEAQLAAAAAEATEVVAVARADARDANADERAALEQTRAEIATAAAALAADREAVVRLHAELTAGLRSLARAMGLQADQPVGTPVVPAVPVAPVFEDGTPRPDASQFAATVRTGPAAAATDAGGEPGGSGPDPGLRADRSSLHDEEHLERAFDEFFSSEVEHEPSRAWIFEE